MPPQAPDAESADGPTDVDDAEDHARTAGHTRPLSVSRSVRYSRQVTEVVRTDEFATWLEKLKDLIGKGRIIRRLDRLAQGNPATRDRSAKDSPSYGSTSDRATGSTTYKMATP